VFAALGIIVLNALLSRSSSRESAMKRWSPLIGGVVLFAFTGVGGERTDFVAHVTGFLGGILLGWIGFLIPANRLANPWVQILAGSAAILLVAIAWTVGIVNQG
jgi:membrane associated rhomboid family serine protease